MLYLDNHNQRMNIYMKQEFNDTIKSFKNTYSKSMALNVEHAIRMDRFMVWLSSISTALLFAGLHTTMIEIQGNLFSIVFLILSIISSLLYRLSSHYYLYYYTVINNNLTNALDGLTQEGSSDKKALKQIQDLTIKLFSLNVDVYVNDGTKMRALKFQWFRKLTNIFLVVAVFSFSICFLMILISTLIRFF